MKVTIEAKARPCPGVERAVILAEDALNRGEKLFTLGQLIHNRREVERLHEMGLKQIRLEDFGLPRKCKEFENATFLVRSHGESEEILEKARGCGMKIVDATCPIVKHSQELVDQHVREGYRILIAGNENHPEVVGLLARTHGSGMIISALSQPDKVDLDDRSFMLAQTTIDGTFFSEIRKSLSARLPWLKIADTTCRFLNNRQKDITDFGKEQDVVLVVGGHNSSNCKLLAKTCQTVNPHVYQVEGPSDIDRKWLKGRENVGISGGASTPRWQLEELKLFLESHKIDENPKGSKNRKGGKFKWLNLKTTK